MREIASNSDNRFDYWIMKEWKVLPTDPRFTDLTFEQREYLWENYLIDNPEIEKKMRDRFDDPEFDKQWDSLGITSQEASEEVLETKEGNDEQEEENEIEANYKVFVNDDSELQMPDYRAILKAKGIVLDNENLDSKIEWEEDDD